MPPRSRGRWRRVPVYYSSFAIARYHRTFPFEVFERYCRGAAPQVYWNTFRWPVQQAVNWTYEDYKGLGVTPERVFPVAGLYAGSGVSYPSATDVEAFAREAAGRGSTGVSFWSYEHMSEAMWVAVRDASPDGGPSGPATGREAPTEEVEMSSLEFQQLSGAHAALIERVARVEAEVETLKGRVAKAAKRPRPPQRTYTVRGGDTLSAIASGLGLSDWRLLYEANRKLIGPNPDMIQPGQVLTIPA